MRRDRTLKGEDIEIDEGTRSSLSQVVLSFDICILMCFFDFMCLVKLDGQDNDFPQGSHLKI